MGNGGSYYGQPLHVLNVNFSGIGLSPFQFHDSSIEKDQISSKFQELLKQHILKQNKKRHQENGQEVQKHLSFDTFEFKVGKIDKFYQKQRYTPIYNKNAGVQQNKLLTIQQFSNYWQQYYSKIWSKSQNKLSDKDAQFNKEQCLLFDRLCYESILKVVYDISDTSNIKQLDPSHYQKFMKKWHSKSYVQNDLKMKLIGQYIIDYHIHITFIQENKESGFQKWQDVLGKQYTVIRGEKEEQSVIIYKNEIAKDLKDDTLSLDKDKLNFNQKTALVKLGPFLLISSHLTAEKYDSKTKQNLNAVQIKEMQQVLYQLNKKERLHIIMGIDSNSFVEKFQDFNIFPSTKKQFTTAKKRTAMQVQTKKSHLLDIQCKDHIITNGRIEYARRMSIKQKDPQNVFLPNEQHPFDHYMLAANVIFQR